MTKGYYTLTRVTDYGPYVTKLILPVPAEVTAQDVSADKFSVFVERMDRKGETLLLPKSWMALDDKEPSRGYIPVKGLPTPPTAREKRPKPAGLSRWKWPMGPCIPCRPPSPPPPG